MSNGTASRKFKWLKILGLTLGVLLVLLVVTYFVATSAWCLQSVILPRVSKATGATITVQDASISPFSSVTLAGLKVQTTGTEPLLTAKQVVARYSLMSIIRGNINVDEVTLNEPVIRVVMNADGTSNLDTFTKKPAGAPMAKAPPSKPAEPPQIDIKKLAINNATIFFSQYQTNGSRTDAEVSRFTFTAANLKNGQTAKLALGAALKFTSVAGTTNELAASLNSAFDIALKPDLMPKQVTGSADLAVAQATGAFADAAQIATKLAVDLSLEEIRQLSLNFAKGDAPLGAITVSGPFDMKEREGKIKINVTGIGHEVLSLVGGRFGILFGGTKLAATYDIELKNQAQFINTTGTITADKFSLTRSNLTTPVIDLQLSYNATVDLPKTTATLRTFTLDAKQGGRPLIAAGLKKEMLLDWGKGAESVAESTLELNLNDLNLADWKPFLGSNVTAGVASGKLLVNVQKAGKQISFDLDSRLVGLAAQAGSNKLDQTDVTLALRGQMADFTKLTLASLGLSVAHAGRPVVTVKGSGKLDAATMDADLETDVEASLVEALKFAPQPDLAFSSGTIKFAGRITQKNLTPDQKTNPSMDQGMIGSFQLTKLKGRAASNVFDNFETTADLNLGLKENVARITKCSGALQQAGQPGGRFDVTGSYQLTNKAGEITLKLTDLNQVVLRTFVAAALGERTLDSISISADTTARYDAKAGSGAKGSVQVVNLLITDPKGQLPKVPLTAEVALDASVNGQGVAEIKRFAGLVRAANQPAGSFDVSGRYDLTNQAGQVAFKLIDLNQNALRPFLAPALGDKKLESVSIYADFNASYAAKGDSAAKGTFVVTNLLVSDPTGSIPNKPLAVGLALDASILKQILQLRQLQLSLAPTERALNQLQLAGKLDLTKSNIYSGNLKLSADSLDFTPYYDMFVTDKKTNAPAPPTHASTTPASTQPAGEPPAVTNIPLRDFTFEVEIGKLFLREVAITGFLEKTRIDGGKVDVNPFQLVLNGAPVSSKMSFDLGVPGYVYDVNFLADKIPLPPLVNSFQPERRGQISGTASANTQIKGAGITGPSLQKNLAGQFDISATNLNLSIANVQSPMMKTLVKVICSIPELIRNPTGKVTSLLGSLTGGSQQTNSTWVEEITKEPIDSVAIVGKAGDGKVALQQAAVQSPAFKAVAAGDVTLAPVLTNSLLHIPLEISLRRSMAADVGLAGNTPTNAPYATLPQFVTMTGTVGEPKADIKYTALAGAAIKVGSSLIGGGAGAAAGSTGSLLGGFLNTGSSGAGAATTTPASVPATTPSTPTTPTTPSLTKPSTPTTPSLTNTNTSTNAPLLQNPLKGFKFGK